MMADFPPIPRYRARWQPVYWEPIPGSGEKITAGIAVKGNDGAVYVQPMLRPYLKKLLRESAAGADDLVQICLDSAARFLLDSFDLSPWRPPVTGFSAGACKEAAANDIAGVAAQAGLACSVFGAASYQRQQRGARPSQTLTALKKQAMAEALRINAAASLYFNRKVKLPGGKIMETVGFLSPPYAANFGAIGNNAGMSTWSDIQAKLWQLDQLRGSQQTDAPAEVGIVVFTAAQPDHDARELYEEVRLECGRRGIETLSAHTPAAAARYLLQKVA